MRVLFWSFVHSVFVGMRNGVSSMYKALNSERPNLANSIQTQCLNECDAALNKRTAKRFIIYSD